MIDYVEIRDKNTRELMGIIDTASSVIWGSSFYGVGQFEIYVSATFDAVSMLSIDNYVTRPNNFEVGVIERIEITDSDADGMMITASGRFVKSILDRRIVYKATLTGSGYNYIWSCESSILSGNLENAVRGLIYDNAINALDTNRNISCIYWTDDDLSNISDIIVTQESSGTETAAEKQVTYKNLLEYTDNLLQEYSCGAKMWLDLENLKFRYKIYKGVDRSRGGGSDNPIIFSKEFDNLVSSEYTFDTSTSKTTALIGGEGEGTARKCAFSYAWISDLSRRETFVDASSLTQEDQTMQDYRKQLETQGQQNIAMLKSVETFSGEIDLTNTTLQYGVDYNLGDLITIEDKSIGITMTTRILKVTEVQDDGGYKIDIEYGI